MKFKVVVIVPAIIIAGMAFISSCGLPGQSEDPTSIGALERAVGPGSQVIKVAAGYNFSMAIVQDSKGKRTLWEIGKNSDGQLGLGDTSDRAYGWVNSGLKNVSAVACGWDHALCLSDNYLYVTGNNEDRQLGIGYTSHNRVIKWTNTGLSQISSIACGYRHNMFVSLGRIWVAGDNYCGQLGLDPYAYPRMPYWAATYATGVSQVACGYMHSMYIADANQSLYVTGANGAGQLGLGYTGSSVTQWTKVPNITAYNINGVSCGQSHSMISAYGPLLSNPAIISNWIWVTGSNQFGQVGQPSYTPHIKTWQQLPYGQIGFISCGANFSLFTAAGGLWVTGRNTHGQLGIGTTDNSYGWRQTMYGNIYNAISGGATHSLFISQKQTWGAGSNEYRELGDLCCFESYSPWFRRNQ